MIWVVELQDGQGKLFECTTWIKLIGFMHATGLQFVIRQDELWKSSLSRLACACRMRLSHGQWSELIADFSRAKGHIAYVLSIKVGESENKTKKLIMNQFYIM